MPYKPVLFIAAIISITLYSCATYSKRPARLYQEVIEKGQTFDAGIVPGFPFQNNKWDSLMKGRMLWACYLYKKGIVKNLIFSGSAVSSPYTEAKIMGLYAEEMGVPSEHIFYETRAEHSTENIYYAYELARIQGFKSVALLTDPLQSSVTKRFTRRRFATQIQHLPFVVDTLKMLNQQDYTIDPSSAFQSDFIPLAERESRFKRLRGTLGAFIPWENRQGRRAAPL
jgi:uncharacterized SAM-binding protein YcdF (DUF218 family)